MSEKSELKRTPLYAAHVRAGARMVEFAGWRMPLAYGSQIEEHHAVRRTAGMFDVSHMTVVDVTGPGAGAYLRRVLANDVGKLDRRRGKAACAALYTCMLNARGGILDDMIVYRLADGCYRLIANAATRARVLAWLDDCAAEYSVERLERGDLALLAVQGPRARELAAPLLPGGDAIAAQPPFTAVRAGEWLLARTGYTGEDGIEVMLPQGEAAALWDELRSRGVVPCGLGARDTLRLEAGLNLYGLDMDESVTPLECGLLWTVDFSGGRAFLGREALQARMDAGGVSEQIGVVLEGRGVLRAGCPVRTAGGDGVVTSGTFGPTLGRAVGLARVRGSAEGPCHVLIRGRAHAARSVKPPFVRNGEIRIELG